MATDTVVSAEVDNMESEAEVLDVLLRSDADTVSTIEIAADLDISLPGAWRRLEQLAEAGLVERTPNHGVLTDRWSLTEAGQTHLAARRGA